MDKIVLFNAVWLENMIANVPEANKPNDRRTSSLHAHARARMPVTHDHVIDTFV